MLVGILQSKRLSGFFSPPTPLRRTAVLFTLPPSPIPINVKPQGRVAGLTGIPQHSRALQTRGGIDTDHVQEQDLQTICLAPDNPVYLGSPSTIWEAKQVQCANW